MAKPKAATPSSSKIKVIANIVPRVKEGEKESAWGVEFEAVASDKAVKAGSGNGCVLVATVDSVLANEMIDCDRAIKF